MDNFFKYLPDIIQEAAQNPFGLFALMVIILSVLGFVFFRKSSERIRAGIFILMFIGVVSFGAVFLRATTNIIAANATSPPQVFKSATSPPQISTRDIATISPYPSNEQGLEAKPFTSAIITLSDGSIVKVLRDGFYPTDLRTAEGQSISVDKMSRFDIVDRSDIPPTLKIKITLINTDVIIVILPFSILNIGGQNELGGFSSTSDKIRSIEFVR